MIQNDAQFLQRAIAVAWQARENGNHPFGAILVDQDGKVVSLRARGPVLMQELEKLLGPAEKAEEKEKEDTKSAIIFTYNDMTKYFASEIISQWQGFGIEELVLFKDPSKPPYLCSYPSLQKGFKRPPPI